MAADFERLRTCSFEYRDVALQKAAWARDRMKTIEKEDILLDLGRLRGPGPAGAFAELALKAVRGEVEAVRARLEAFELKAKAIYKSASQAMIEGRWKDAYDKLTDLLEDANLKETKHVSERRDLMESERKQAEERLPSVKLSQYFNGRTEHLAGTKVKHDEYRWALILDFDDESELERFDLTPGRIGIVSVERLRFNVPIPGVEDEPEKVVERQLAFFPPENGRKDWLDKHPLRFESPFLYYKAMSIEFQVRFDDPVALLISLAGTNVIILSDDGRKENGRGVHIWQSLDLTRPDLAVPARHRKIYLDANPDKLKGDAARHEYFQFERGRWYRVRFVRGEKTTSLYVGDRLVVSKDLGRFRAKGHEITLRTWSPCRLDEIRIEGTLDPDWYGKRVVRSR